VFAAEEVAELLAAEDRLAAFFATWTRKEAVIKATGLGVSQDLSGFSTLGCVLRGDPAVGRPEAWSLADVEVEDGYPAAVALIAPDARVGAVTWL
jgi:4'-phosphopantetheinyl transferase